MWFVSKKKYNALLEQKEDLGRIAADAIAQNGRLLDNLGAATKEMKDIQELNHQLAKHNDVLLAAFKQMEKQRDVWRERAKEENKQVEIYREMLKGAEVE